MSVGAPASYFEKLEARVFLDAAPLDVSSEITPLGPELRVVGTDGDDKIYLSRFGRSTLIVSGTGWSMLWDAPVNAIRVDGMGGDDRIVVRSNIWTSAALYGGDGRDTIYGGGGTDRLYGGGGVDYLLGGDGNDTIVGVGDDAADRITGGRGIDSYWLDATQRERIVDLEDEEIAGRGEHRIDHFIGGQSGDDTEDGFPIAIAGQTLTNPELTVGASNYANFSTQPLFSQFGPEPEDIIQGALNDCYLLAALGALAKTDPQTIRQSMANLGDGTYAVRFTNGASDIYVRVDADLPINASGSLAYAQFGAQGSMWVPIFEKAYAFYRLGDGKYSSLAGGYAGDLFEDLGLPMTGTFITPSGQALLEQLASQLAAGQAVCFATGYSVGDAPVITGHAYVVMDVIKDDLGQPVAVSLRNPWGRDGAGSDGADDGIIQLDATQAMNAFWFTVAASPLSSKPA